MILLSFYGPVQGMVRIDNAKPSGYSQSIALAKVIKQKGCAGCPRLNSGCQGVGWIGLESAYLSEHQGHPVHASGSEKCQLVGKKIEVPENLVISKQ
jgi:hypothetical protein